MPYQTLPLPFFYNTTRPPLFAASMTDRVLTILIMTAILLFFMGFIIVATLFGRRWRRGRSIMIGGVRFRVDEVPSHLLPSYPGRIDTGATIEFAVFPRDSVVLEDDPVQSTNVATEE